MWYSSAVRLASNTVSVDSIWLSLHYDRDDMGSSRRYDIAIRLDIILMQDEAPSYAGDAGDALYIGTHITSSGSRDK